MKKHSHFCSESKKKQRDFTHKKNQGSLYLFILIACLISLDYLYTLWVSVCKCIIADRCTCACTCVLLYVCVLCTLISQSWSNKQRKVVCWTPVRKTLQFPTACSELIFAWRLHWDGGIFGGNFTTHCRAWLAWSVEGQVSYRSIRVTCCSRPFAFPRLAGCNPLTPT